MWADDIHWLPQALAGEKLRGVVEFTHGAEFPVCLHRGMNAHCESGGGRGT
jgi:hypothetical protein